jgi:hypothetical protein
MARIALPSVVALASVLSTSGAAWAEADALELIREGVALRKQGSDGAALQRFQRAYEIDHDARALAQIGLAEQALGRWVAAHEHLMKALASTTDPWIAKNGATLRTSLEMVGGHVGKLEVLGGSPGAEVRIDGIARGLLPLEAPLILTAGSVTIAVGGTGFVSVERVAVIRAREMTRESFEPLATLARTPPSRRVAKNETPEPAQDTPATYSGPKVPTIVSASSNEGRFNARSSAKWISWGAATVAVAVGVVAYTQQTGAGSQFNNDCYYDQSGTIRVMDGAQISSDGCKGLSGRVDTWYRTEVGALIGAAALASIGVVFWLTEPAAPSSSAALSCVPGTAGGRGVSWGCRWRF